MSKIDWNNTEEVKEYRKKINHRWYLSNKENIKDERAEYRKVYQPKYQKTPMGRASYLVSNYRAMDRKNGFGDVIDFDAKWIVENIFTQKCAHCEETDWRSIGCNRIDNNKPHIIDNVEPCCEDCNNRLNYNALKMQVDQIDMVTGEVINHWESASEAARENGFMQSHISECCKGNKKQYKGYKWSYTPLQ